MNRDQCKDLPEFKVKLVPGPWLAEFKGYSDLDVMFCSAKGAMVGKTRFDVLTPTYLADLWLRGLLSRECLDDMSESELVSMRTRIKNSTFELRVAGDAAGRYAAQRLDEITAYMRRRFPRRGSTPPCESVCV